MTDRLKLYLVTTVNERWPGKGAESPTNPGIFSTMEQARRVVLENWNDIHERSFRYAVISEIQTGLYQVPTMEEWYEWHGDADSGRYVPCAYKPEKYAHVVFGLL